jgi:hypothetical protein
VVIFEVPMTQLALKLHIPEQLERKARKAGLLSGKFLRGAIEQELARRGAARRLAHHVARFRAAGINPLSADDVAAEVRAVRAAKRGKRAHRR